MSNGQGCTCNAWAANECACGADWTPQEVYDLRTENERLKAELAEVKKDAERYHWLRNQNELLEDNTFYVGIDNSEEPDDINWVGADLDSAIDAAMEKEK